MSEIHETVFLLNFNIRNFMSEIQFLKYDLRLLIYFKNLMIYFDPLVQRIRGSYRQNQSF